MPIPAPPLAKRDPDKPVLLPIAQDLLHEALRAQRKTVTALAAELGIARKHLSNVLHGHAPIALPLLQRLGEAPGVAPERLVCLLDRGAEPRPEPYGVMPGWVVAHDDLTLPIEGWEMLEG